jgi:hypothetical protein
MVEREREKKSRKRRRKKIRCRNWNLEKSKKEKAGGIKLEEEIEKGVAVKGVKIGKCRVRKEGRKAGMGLEAGKVTVRGERTRGWHINLEN